LGADEEEILGLRDIKPDDLGDKILEEYIEAMDQTSNGSDFKW
jgi:hypothetical protein